MPKRPATPRTFCLAFLVLTAAAATGCSSSAAAGRVATQNADNATALVANAAMLASLCEAQTAAMGHLRMEDARRKTAVALVRSLSASEADRAAAATELRAMIDAAAPSRREAVIAALAQREPALVDIAAAVPGFTLARVADDAAALDALLVRIEEERDEVIRRGLVDRRDALLAPCALVRLAAAAAQEDADALDDLAATMREQAGVLALHARSMADIAQGAGAREIAVADVYRSAGLRDLALDSIERSRGREARDRLADWLARADAAVAVMAAD